MHKVYFADSFWRNAQKELSEEQRRRLKIFCKTLAEQPHRGETLGPTWLREIKMHNKRVYFAVGSKTILFLDVSDKQNQQVIINSLRKKEQEIGEHIKPLF